VPVKRPLEKLSVIIPVYNEQSTVREVIERVTSLPLPLELIVVDDGSTDDTPQILREEAEGKKLDYLTDGFSAAWWLLWLRFARTRDREQSDS